MNLPLPPYYDMVWLRLDGSGSAALGTFLNLCEINRLNSDCVNIFNGKAIYTEVYPKLLKDKDSFNLLSIAEYFNDSIAKFCSLVQKPVLAYCNVRDQIERFNVAINHIGNWRYEPLAKKFNFTCRDYKSLFPEPSYEVCTQDLITFASSIPAVSSLYLYYPKMQRSTSINFHKRLEYLTLKDIIYVDMSEISFSKAFDTFTRLSSIFGFKAPKEQDRHIFEGKIYSGMSYAHFPVTLYAHPNDISCQKQDLSSLEKEGGFELILTLKQRVQDLSLYKDLTQEILLNPKDNVIVLIEKDKAEAFLQNQALFNEAKKYLQEYMQAYSLELKRIKDSLVSAEQILSYLREHKNLRMHIKTSLDKSLQDLKSKRPDIVASWKYYQEFEKMCEEG